VEQNQGDDEGAYQNGQLRYLNQAQVGFRLGQVGHGHQGGQGEWIRREMALSQELQPSSGEVLFGSEGGLDGVDAHDSGRDDDGVG